jgi:hypothetical protein
MFKEVLKGIIAIVVALFPLTLFSQEVLFSAKVVESETDTPIYGAVITVNDSILASTDDNGVFKIAIIPHSKSKICITHIAYEPICFENTTEIPSKIVLKPHITQLEEVVVYRKKDFDIKDFVKRIRKVYKNTMESGFSVPFKARELSFGEKGMNYYTELDGRGIFASLLNTKIFDMPTFIVCQARFIEVVYPDPFSLSKYNFYIANHPLKKSSYYNFWLEATENINGKAYWVLCYKLKKKIVNETRYFIHSEGKMWIDCDSYKLSKERFSIAFEEKSLVEGDIFYTPIDGYLITNKISFTLKNYQSKRDFAHILLDFYIPQNRQLYKNLVTPELLACSRKKIVYDKDYWQKYPIEEGSWHYKEILLAAGSSTLTQAFEAPKNTTAYKELDVYNKRCKGAIKRASSSKEERRELKKEIEEEEY